MVAAEFDKFSSNMNKPAERLSDPAKLCEFTRTQADAREREARNIRHYAPTGAPVVNPFELHE
ncbi:hypothetical protein LB542_06245 [Mesorhizobium sp. BR1-1-9]|uniref:hypothetical protein n=1 Tax=unclassified Mesorhizobium TaxID=325217 RepID=UPI001CD10F32|nr:MULTISPECIES: hypothetical protein [unclassified Mesorhizobium]MBZ9870456.1 hypothetical protein [Mesorhizobium sp. BR1-1-9]MBZ9942388.1 hypothetical protein [Mesorhizobium sp. BR1-1-13]